MKKYVALFALFTGGAFAQPTTPPLQDISPDVDIEPEVTIRKGPNADIVEEYRVGGQLYMIKVTPSKGVPYFLVDADGDGNLETRRNDVEPDLLIPSWVILRFK